MSLVLNGTTQYGYRNNNIAPAAPFTVAGFFKPSDNTALGAIWGQSAGDDTYDYFRMGYRGDEAGDPVGCYVRRGVGAVGDAVSTTGTTQDQWHHAAFVEAGAQDHRIYLDGGSKAVDTVNNVVPDSVLKIGIGALPYNGTYANLFPGKIWHMAMWDIALTDAEILQLNNGADPRTIQSGNLVAYWKLESDGEDYSTNDYELTLVDSPTFDSDEPTFSPPAQSDITVVVGHRITDGDNQASVWAYDSAGELLWTYDTGHDTNRVVLDSSENVYVAGRAADNGSGLKNFWKLNSAGILQGGRYVRSAAWGWGVALDSLGRIIVGTGNGASRVSTDLASEEIIVSGGSIFAVDVDLVDDGIYLCSGGSYTNLRRYDSSLSYDWGVDPHTTTTVKTIDILSDRRVVIGFSHSAGVSVLRCYTHLGAYSWDYSGLSTNINALVVDADDNTYAVSSDVVTKTLLKLDSEGGELWYTAHPEGQVLRGIHFGADGVYASGERSGAICVWKGQSLNPAIKVPCDRIDDIAGLLTSSVTPTRRRVDYYTDNWGGSLDFSGVNWKAQTWTATDNYDISAIRIGFLRQGDGGGDCTVSIRATTGGVPTGPDLAVISPFAGGDITTMVTGEVREFSLVTPLSVTNGTVYAVVIRSPAATIYDRLLLNAEIAGTGYAAGQRYDSADSGSSWSPVASTEILFEIVKDLIISPTITDESTSQSILVGQELSLFVTATGDPAPTYQWYFNEVAITGATSSTYVTFAGATGNYKCIVTNVGGSAESSQIPVVVSANPYRINMFNLYLDHDELS